MLIWVNYMERLVSSATLIFYDWFLTSGDELAYLWRRDRTIYIRVLFFLVRYPALVSTVLNVIPPTFTWEIVEVCLRAVIFICSELILAARAWAIWGKNRRILVFLVVFSIVR